MEEISVLRARVHTPLRCVSPLQRYRPEPGRHAVDGDLVMTAIGGPGPEYNTAVVLGPEPPERVFALATTFFAGSQYAVAIEVGAAQPMEDALQTRGWQLDEEEPALVLSRIPAPAAAPSGLTICPVTTETQFEEFLALQGSPYRWVPSLQAALDPSVALFVGYLRAEPVATARLTCFGEVGEILGVMTQPAHRRQGFGQALTWAAIAEAARRGCASITLQASESGYRLYRRMGFVPVCTYRTYLPPQ